MSAWGRCRDVTCDVLCILCTHDIAARISDWHVDKGEATLSDHRLISYTLRMPRPKKEMRRNLKKLDVEIFKARVEELCEGWGPAEWWTILDLSLIHI